MGNRLWFQRRRRRRWPSPPQRALRNKCRRPPPPSPPSCRRPQQRPPLLRKLKVKERAKAKVKVKVKAKATNQPTNQPTNRRPRCLTNRQASKLQSWSTLIRAAALCCPAWRCVALFFQLSFEYTHSIRMQNIIINNQNC